MGDLGKAEMLKTETLKAERAIANSNQTGKAPNRLDEVKGRMLRWTPRFGGIGRIHGGFHLRVPWLSRPLCQDFFWRQFFGESVWIFRCIREPWCGRRPNGFQVLSMSASGRTSLGQAH